jgi:hypothetical protein
MWQTRAALDDQGSVALESRNRSIPDGPRDRLVGPVALPGVCGRLKLRQLQLVDAESVRGASEPAILCTLVEE